MESIKNNATKWGEEADKINKNFNEILSSMLQQKDSTSSTLFTDIFFLTI